MSTQNTDLATVIKCFENNSPLVQKVKELQEKYKDLSSFKKQDCDTFLACIIDSFMDDIDEETLANALTWYNGYGGRSNVGLHLSAIETNLDMSTNEALQSVIRATPSNLVLGWETLGKSYIVYP